MTERDLAAVWTVLESSPPSVGLVAVGIGHEVQAGEFLVAIDRSGRRYLLLPLLPGEAARVDTKGNAVHLVKLQHQHLMYMAIVCVRPELNTVFTQFCRELVGSAASANSPARAAADAFDRWRKLFAEADERKPVGEKQLIGILGELLTLEALLLKHAPPAVDYWTGPSGETHDFRTVSHALEVKSTLVREGRIVSISSVDQLQAAPSVRLCVVHHRFERAPGGNNLSDLVNRLEVLGASQAGLAGGLSDVGIYIDNLDPYGGQRYRLVETRFYDVAAYAFPRITRTSFSNGDMPAGTLNLSYSIDLTNEPPFPLAQGASDELLTAMAKEAMHGMGS